MWPLPVAQRAIIVSGCLAMAYTQLTLSPATIEYARQYGANGLHIGILGALPTATLFMQFVAALVVNHVRRRRWLWFGVSLVQRLVFVPLALGPLLLPEAPAAVWIWGLILATAVNHMMLHFCTPLWMSWMGDYLPHRGLNKFWGSRHVWMQWSAAATLLAGAVLLLKSGLAMVPAFAVLIVIGAVCGVADLLLFLKVDEPPVCPMPQPTLRRVLAGPFCHGQFRTFITYSCFWHFAAMVGAPFISLYMLSYIGMDLWSVLLLWSLSWVGGAILSGRLGHLAEEFGHRPLLILCTAFKSINMLALMLVPIDPQTAFWWLVPVFMLDALLNAGISIASNGFMLKYSPQENRTMFIAAGTALAGIVGGLTALAAGAVLAGMNGWSMQRWGVTIVGFHVLFGASLLLRLVAIVLAFRVHEPEAHGATYVAMQLIGATPMRMLRFPLGLYRTPEILEEAPTVRRLEPTGDTEPQAVVRA